MVDSPFVASVVIVGIYGDRETDWFDCINGHSCAQVPTRTRPLENAPKPALYPAASGVLLFTNVADLNALSHVAITFRNLKANVQYRAVRLSVRHAHGLSAHKKGAVLK